MNEQGQPKRDTRCLKAGQLMAWHDGALPLGETAEVMTHLAVCARCAALESALTQDRRQVFALLSRLDPPPNVTVVTEASLARFEERLTARNSGTLMDRSNEHRSSGGLPLAGSETETSDANLNPVPLSTPTHHPWGLAQTLVVALVIAALLGTILLLLSPWLGHSTKAPFGGSIGTPVTVQTQAGGLEMTMQITPGPYFLSELLAANLSLTNHSQTTYLLQGRPNEAGQPPDPCNPPLTVVMIGGEPPFAANLQSTLAAHFTCHGPPGLEQGTVQLHPGQTITIPQYIALTSSGHLTLAVRATFQKMVYGPNFFGVVPAPGPLDRHWPTLQVSVQPQVPSDRLLSLRQQGEQVIVTAPPAARGQLLYMSLTHCDLGGGDTGGGGYFPWVALQTMTIPPPDCGFTVTNGTRTPGRLLWWAYVVAAPGYTIVSGTYTP